MDRVGFVKLPSVVFLHIRGMRFVFLQDPLPQQKLILNLRTLVELHSVAVDRHKRLGWIHERESEHTGQD